MSATPTPSSPEAADADVLIVGAGPAGLALACALHDAGLAVQVLDQQSTAALAAPAEDGREIALTHRGRGVLQALGVWRHLPASDIAPLRAAHVTDGSGPQTLRFGTERLADAAADPLGWLVPNHLIRAAAWAALADRPAVRLHTDARVAGLTLPDAADGRALAQLTLADGQRLQAPLMVAADSRFSGTRRLAGIGAAMRDFGRSVVVGRVAHSADHQGIARECFRYGNTLALLPLNGGMSSAVLTLPADQAPAWLALSDAEFARRVVVQSGGVLGEVRAAGPRHHYPLVGVLAHRFATPGFALVGDAAVGMHPVTAHGYNLGLYGVQVLARQLAAAQRSGRPLGSLAVLQPYADEHRRQALPLYLGTNVVVSLFTDERSPARLARRVVLGLAEHAPGLSGLLKAAITRQLTGRTSGSSGAGGTARPALTAATR